MTIQSLCSAIRSQLCFSQVSSWVDLLKKALVKGEMTARQQIPNLFSDEIMQNPRLKKNLQTMQVDLDILFRIKPYDGTSCFNDKPNVHNFPDTLVSDRMALRVGLKSLPRLEKIPTLNTEKANINGFSCDNRIKSILTPVQMSSSPVAGSSCHVLNDRVVSSCHETGKHRCKNDDEEEFFVERNCSDASKQSPPTAKCSNASEAPQQAATTLTPATTSQDPGPSNLTHRERQLLKYKKRLMKRDKQKKKAPEGDQTSVSSLNTSGSEDFDKFQDAVAINEHFEPLYGAGAKAEGPGESISTATTNQQPNSKTLSIATQTDDAGRCGGCGEELQCWNCDKNQINFKSQTTSSLSIKIGSVLGTMIGNKSELLLQAIQRTADAHPDGSNGAVTRDKTKDNIFTSSKTAAHHGDSSPATPSTVATDASRDCDTTNDNNNYLINNNNLNGDKEGAHTKMDNDCRLCKRQKTRHNYTSSMSVSSNSSAGSYRRTMSECLVGMNPEDEDEVDGAMNCSPLPVHNCDDAEFNYASALAAATNEDALTYGELKAYRRAFSEDVINQLPAESCCFESNEDEDCLTIKCNHCRSEKTTMESPAALKLTPNVTLQHARSVVSMSPHKKLLMNQKIPKINLSHVFDNIQDDSGIGHDTESSPTSDNVFAFNTSPASSYPPTLMQLSPRFARGTNSFLKRRSRHISDRSSISEYSNISDEDEEVLKVTIEAVEPLPAPPAPASSSSKISSLYKKFVTKTHSAFNKLPLLGTMEESLLRDRFQPKAIVSGFKLLLGASGSFCPTQLTIPAQTFFYEFKGMKHMSTPYVVSSQNFACFLCYF